MREMGHTEVRSGWEGWRNRFGMRPLWESAQVQVVWHEACDSTRDCAERTFECGSAESTEDFSHEDSTDVGGDPARPYELFPSGATDAARWHAGNEHASRRAAGYEPCLSSGQHAGPTVCCKSWQPRRTSGSDSQSGGEPGDTSDRYGSRRGDAFRACGTGEQAGHEDRQDRG